MGFSIIHQNDLCCHLKICILALVVALGAGEALSQSGTTPEDVNRMLLRAKDHVIELRVQAGIDKQWPEVEILAERNPRHTLQKTREIFIKINRMRKIRSMGEITIPYSSSGKVLSKNVFNECARIVGELEILLDSPLQVHRKYVAPPTPIRIAENYELLAEISQALDPVIGVRGFRPGDVYAQSVVVLENARFLRQSQSLDMDVEPPTTIIGRHSNHALRAAIGLMSDIAQYDRRLWISACDTPEVPQRKITSNEVYDQLLIILAEQERIMYRLGLDHYVSSPEVDPSQTSDSTVFNIEYARLLMPTFDLGEPLVQYNKRSLMRSPRDVYRIAETVRLQLEQYRVTRGIRTPPIIGEQSADRKPMHVHQMTMACLHKTNKLRGQLSVYPTSIPDAPPKAVSPTDVYEQAARLQAEISLLCGDSAQSQSEVATEFVIGHEISPSDVYALMAHNSALLDTILGTNGYTADDMYQQAQLITQEALGLQVHLGVVVHTPRSVIAQTNGPQDLIELIHEMFGILEQAQIRSGMSDTVVMLQIPRLKLHPSDVFNQMGTVLTEIDAFKVHLGISTNPAMPPWSDGHSHAQVYEELEHAHRLLESVLFVDPKASGESFVSVEEQP